MANRFLISLFSCALFFGAQARADVADVLPVGDLERWGALALGLNGVGSRLLSDAQIQGDVGMAGVSRLALTNDAWIEGDLYFRHNGIMRLGQGTGMSGTEFPNQDALLTQETNSALDFAKAAGALALTRSYSIINLTGSNTLSLSGAPGETVVLNLRSFAMGGNSILNLSGAADTTFVINVNKGFSLTSAAKIVLSGGLDWNDVVFNIRGKGPNVQLSGTASLQGIIVATRRTVALRDSAMVRGEVIADALTMQGTSIIDYPSVVSP